MRLQEDINFTTLAWVKPELDDTLRQARRSLEAYVEEPGDGSQMRFCATYLHQVQGSLRMVELYGAAMVAEEMEQLAQALVEGQVADRDEGFAVLMRGIMQLPDYLERVQSGFKDIPIVLLPLLNELRAARGEAGLSESALFSPDLLRPLPERARGPLAALPDAEMRQRARALHERFQSALLAWLRDEDNAGNISALAEACQQLVAAVREESARRLFWVAAGTLDALRAGAFEASKALKQALAKVEREIKRLAEQGEAAVAQDPPLELTRQLLYFVAHAPTQHERIGELRKVFELDAYVPDERELEHARGSMSGHNRALLDAVASAIKEDLLRVKDALDLHMRNLDAPASPLGEQAERLAQVADTLGMLGLDVPRRVVQEQRQALQQVAVAGRVPDESALLDIAGALLYVEASLDDQVARLGHEETLVAEGRTGVQTLPESEARRLLEGLVREASANFAQARQSFVAFIETGWDHAQLADVPRLLEEVAGALRILELDKAPAYLAQVARFTEQELLSHHRVPNATQLDTLADALASLEYYLEALADHRGGREQILDLTRVSLAKLGYWPPLARAEEAAPAALELAAPAPAAPASAVVQPAEAMVDAGHEPAPAAAAEEAAVEPVAAAAAEPAPAPAAVPATSAESAAPVPPPSPVPAAPALAGFEGAGDEIDDEIREVFLEEVAEEVANLDALLADWRLTPENLDLLRPIRRVFHTLKGSGRLVGALVLGEFSWRIESMLNRVLDGTRPASPAVVALTEHARHALPGLQAMLRGEPAPGLDLATIQDAADRIAGGEEYELPEAASAQPPTPAEPAEAAVAEAEAAVASVLPEPDGPAVAVDPVLLEILRAEVGGHLLSVEAWLSQCQPQPQPANDPLLRAVHTMNGAFAMAEVPLVGEVTGPLESYVKRLLVSGRTPGAEAVAVLADAAAALQRVLVELERPEPRLSTFGDLPARLQRLRDTLPEPKGPALPLDTEATDEAEAMLPEVALPEAPDLSALPDLGEPATPGIETAGFDAVESEPAPDAAEAEAELARLIEEFEATEAARKIAPAPSGASTEPEAVEAEAVEAEVVEPAAVEPEAVEPEAVEPEAVEPEAVEAEAVEAEAVEPEAVEAEAVEAEAVEAEAVEPEAVEAEAVELKVAEAEYDLAPAAVAEDPDPDLPLDLTELDVDLLDIFAEESHDLLDHADGLLAQLREQPGEREPVTGLQRDLHTLKGGARMAGIVEIGELGHVMESLLEAVADGRRELDRDGVRVLEAGLDRLHRMLGRVTQRRAVALPQSLIARLDTLARGQAYTSRAERPDEVPELLALKPLSEPLSAEDLPAELEGLGPRAPQEQVRIRADLLDRLVNYAGEVAIYRARLEQQLGAFRGNLIELDQTNTRLRDQLRKLEIETEAQIIARFQRETDSGEPEFDPLELDRFSTLQQISRALSESAADLVVLQHTLEELTRQYESLLLQQSRVSSDLQEGLMRTRMVPFDSLVPRLRRVLRQAGIDTGKQVRLKVEGAQGEMDRNVLDRMTAPLEHMLRNAVAHGLEMPRQRHKAGKPEEGTVLIAISREGSEVVIAVSDDGAGIDAEAIRRKAIERGRLAQEQSVEEADLFAFILETGFSTATDVSRLAGRGVGMDVVYNEIRQLGGSLQIESKRGQGTRFIIRLPFSMAVTQAVFVQIGETSFAVPIASVKGVGRIARGDLEAAATAGKRIEFEYVGESYPVHDLGALLGHAPAKAAESLQMPVLLIQSGELRAAVQVDQVLGNREIVVKPVGPQVSSIPGVFGATVMGDGRVVVILDIAPLVRHQASAERLARETATAPVVREVPLVMVVDDSITMRKVTGRVLERHNLEILTAKDGVDAIEKMAERVPDLMLLDIEMPRMDGYELATYMRGDARLRDVPIIVITSRSGEKHRQRAFEIGINRYLGKPYQEPELVRNVFELLEETRRSHA